MRCENCEGALNVTNSNKCYDGVGSNDIPKALKPLFKDLIYRSWKCGKCNISIKTAEAKVSEILDVAKNAKLELLDQAKNLITSK